MLLPALANAADTKPPPIPKPDYTPKPPPKDVVPNIPVPPAAVLLWTCVPAKEDPLVRLLQQ